MPSISQKAVTMPESPIRKLVPYAEKAKAEGKLRKLLVTQFAILMKK